MVRPPVPRHHTNVASCRGVPWFALPSLATTPTSRLVGASHWLARVPAKETSRPKHPPNQLSSVPSIKLCALGGKVSKLRPFQPARPHPPSFPQCPLFNSVPLGGKVSKPRPFQPAHITRMRVRASRWPIRLTCAITFRKTKLLFLCALFLTLCRRAVSTRPSVVKCLNFALPVAHITRMRVRASRWPIRLTCAITFRKTKLLFLCALLNSVTSVVNSVSPLGGKVSKTTPTSPIPVSPYHSNARPGEPVAHPPHMRNHLSQD